VNTVTLKQPMT